MCAPHPSFSPIALRAKEMGDRAGHIACVPRYAPSCLRLMHRFPLPHPKPRTHMHAHAMAGKEAGASFATGPYGTARAAAVEATSASCLPCHRPIGSVSLPVASSASLQRRHTRNQRERPATVHRPHNTSPTKKAVSNFYLRQPLFI